MSKDDVTTNPAGQPAEDVEAPPEEESVTQPLVEGASPEGSVEADWSKVCDQGDQDNTWVILLMLAAVVWYAIGVVWFCLYEDLSFIDGWYLTTVTVTTVGYGVIVPSDELSRAVVACYMLVSVFFIAYGILNFTAFCLSRLEEVMTTTGLQELQPSCCKMFGGKAITTVVIMILCIALGTLLGYFHMHFSFINSFYWSVLTLTTVGYGDFVPKAAPQRVTGGLFVLIGTSTFALCVTQLMAILISACKRNTFLSYMTPPLTQEALEALDVSGTLAKTGDVSISRDQYLRFMLIKGGFVDYGVIEDFDQAFDRLDADLNGVLDKDDLGQLGGHASEAISKAFSHISHDSVL